MYLSDIDLLIFLTFVSYYIAIAPKAVSSFFNGSRRDSGKTRILKGKGVVGFFCLT